MYNQARGGRRSTKREKREKRGESSSSGSFATVVRVDGSAQARWTHGSGIAVSIDREKKSDGMVGWRTFVSSAPSGGTMVCSLDPNGYGSMNRRSGKTLVCFSGNGSGSLMNVEGRVMKRWDSKGKVTLPDGVTPSWLGLKEGENFLKIKLVEEKKKKHSIVATLVVEERGGGGGGGGEETSAVSLEVMFKCGNITQTFVHGHNVMPPASSGQ
jgi:hypothetical protein